MRMTLPCLRCRVTRCHDLTFRGIRGYTAGRLQLSLKAMVAAQRKAQKYHNSRKRLTMSSGHAKHASETELYYSDYCSRVLSASPDTQSRFMPQLCERGYPWSGVLHHCPAKSSADALLCQLFIVVPALSTRPLHRNFGCGCHWLLAQPNVRCHCPSPRCD